MHRFNIAGIQMACLVGDEERNLSKAFALIDKAVQKGARLVCLPELFLTGYDLPYIKEHALPIPNDFVQRLKDKAKETETPIIAGIPYRTPKGIYNGAFLFGASGDIKGIYNKMHLFSMRELYEPDYFIHGEPDYSIYDIDFLKIGMIICYDLRFPELARKLTLNGAQLIVAISAWPKKRIRQFTTVTASRAIENQLYVFAVNRTGVDGQTELGGHTALYNPVGEPVPGSTFEDREESIVAKIDLEEIVKTREALGCLKDRFLHYGI